jgi:hypothetical protein
MSKGMVREVGSKPLFQIVFRQKYASHHWSWLYVTMSGFYVFSTFSFFPSFDISQFLSYAIHNRKDEDWKHENASEMMFDYLVRDNNIPIPEKDQLFIKALIAGEPSRT